MSRRILQVVNGLLGLATLALGAVQLVSGVDSPIYAGADLPASAVLDSNLRFFGGLGMGIGLVLVWITPSIERHTRLFRMAWMCGFLGGLGRVVSLAALGSPSLPLQIFTWVEVIGAPILIYWQHRIARDSPEVDL